MRILTIVLVISLCVSLPLLAADTLVKQDPLAPMTGNTLNATSVKSSFSLLDFSRLHMSQSYSLSYVSGSGQGRMIGMYLNQIDYEFAKPLHASFTIGWLHQPQTLFGANRQINNQLLPGFQLLWTPSDKFHLSVGFETMAPYSLYYNNSLLGRYGSRYIGR